MSLEPGQELPELKVTPDRYLTYRYAGASGDFNPIHIDEDFAKSVGPPGPHPPRALDDVPGRARGHRGGRRTGVAKRLEVQFRGMGFPEQEITVTASVKDVADGVATIVTEAEQDGRRIIRKGQAELQVG